MNEDNPTLSRLEDQIHYYSTSSRKNKLWFKGLKTVEIFIAAIIPFSAGFSAPVQITGGLGMLIVVLEGLQGLNQYQHNWITYRATSEELKHEKYLWLAKAGPYAATSNRDTLLAERVESLISRENAKWVSSREQSNKEKTGTDE